MYTWGHNGYSQLGNGNSNQGLIPSPLTSALQMKKVVQVACGSHHSLSLTDDGEVISFFMVIINISLWQDYITMAGLANHARISSVSRALDCGVVGRGFDS